MTLRFRPRMQDCIPIDVSSLWCQATGSVGTLAMLDVGQIASRRIRVGNRERAIEDLFDIERLQPSHPDVRAVERETGRVPDQIWSGPLSFVNGIGQEMNGGLIWVDGSCGDFSGAGMTGGTLVVRGDVGGMAGQSMQGGTLLVSGNAGDYCGADRTGEPHGTNRGLIAIGGNAGMFTAAGMRRGLIWVAGAAGPGLGHHMKAGTVWVAGDTGPSVGDMMVRGTIILNTVRDLPSSHVRSGPFESPILRLLATWATTQWPGRLVPHPKQCPRYLQFHGDAANGSRGEILISY